VIGLASYTPDGLIFDAAVHRYTLHGRDLINVTGALGVAGLVDRAFFTEEDRQRGARVHAAIARYHRDLTTADDPASPDYDPTIAPYLRAYRRFLAESAFRVDACEEMLADAPLMIAGTLDLRGQFIDGRGSDNDRVDVIDVKTGTTPPWVGYQLAGYVRMLPPDVARRARRWSLNLAADRAVYRLEPHTKTTDERVFLAAVTIAQARRGWL
jgi:hypothetical protein